MAMAHTEDTEMKQRRNAPVQYLAGEEGCGVKRMILPVFFRVFPCASVANQVVDRSTIPLMRKPSC